MPEKRWTQENTGWPQAAQPYIDAAQAAYDQGAAGARSGVGPAYVPTSSERPLVSDALMNVYAAAWNANVVLGSNAKTKQEIDGAAERRRMFRQEAGRAITKGLTDGMAGSGHRYQPVAQWYSGKRTSYPTMLADMYADAYRIGQTYRQ